ncbi:WbqC family protein [Parasediminibacterium sp. JCM 36343]|uniref:WbqC family protein n=1 Tax=Parasediminibacterium sp. JCM 36343 TaxID=3374279 RepID=UPI00397B5707
MIIIENQYFAPVNYYVALFENTHCKIEQFEAYQKMSFRNRCIVVGSNGLINLTIPVEGGRNSRQLVKDIKISYSEAWQDRHWKAIVSSYAKAPFFEYYKHVAEKLIKKQDAFLLDKNMAILAWLKKVFHLPTEIELTNEYVDTMSVGEKDFRNHWLPKNYKDVDSSQVVYNQVFESKLGFKKNASIMDLLFCEGPNAKDLLKAAATGNEAG